MSEEKKSSPLADIVSRITNGAANLKASRRSPPDEEEEDSAQLNSRPNFTEVDADRGSSEGIIDDPLMIDEQDQAPPAKPPAKQMTTKKKVILAAVVVCIAVMAKNGYLSPQPPDAPSKPTSASSESTTDLPPLQVSEKNLDTGLTSALGEPTTPDPDVGQTLDQLELDGPFQKPVLNPALRGAPEQEPASLSEGFGFPVSPESGHTAQAPLEVGGKGASESNTETLPNPFNGHAQPNPDQPVAQANSPFGDASSQGAEKGQSPLPANEKDDPVLDSARPKNPDSGFQPSQQSDTGDLKRMEGLLARKDGEIASLKAQLRDSEKKAHPQRAKPAPHPPSQSPAVAQRANPRAVPATKVAPRPKVCVKAIAPPARNCPSCVAHAFIVDTGAESMVGQGDHLAGYRVSITGDRLDLQNSDGQVVHKFWSQPNGCPSI